MAVRYFPFGQPGYGFRACEHWPKTHSPRRNGCGQTLDADLLGVLKGQADVLDQDYLNGWAHELRMADLLRRALDEAGLRWQVGHGVEFVATYPEDSRFEGIQE